MKSPMKSPHQGSTRFGLPEISETLSAAHMYVLAAACSRVSSQSRSRILHPAQEKRMKEREAATAQLLQETGFAEVPHILGKP